MREESDIFIFGLGSLTSLVILYGFASVSVKTISILFYSSYYSQNNPYSYSSVFLWEYSWCIGVCICISCVCGAKLSDVISRSVYLSLTVCFNIRFLKSGN